MNSFWDVLFERQDRNLDWIDSGEFQKICTGDFPGRPFQRIRESDIDYYILEMPAQWAYLHQVTFDSSRPGKPTDNALVESFNGRLRDECLNTNWDLSLDDAKRKIEAWREHYNQSRPHTGLGYVPPREFAQQALRNTVA